MNDFNSDLTIAGAVFGLVFGISKLFSSVFNAFFGSKYITEKQLEPFKEKLANIQINVVELREAITNIKGTVDKSYNSNFALIKILLDNNKGLK